MNFKNTRHVYLEFSAPRPGAANPVLNRNRGTASGQTDKAEIKCNTQT